MVRYIIFLFLIGTTFATITTPFEMTLATGYRQDHLKWRLQEPGDPSTTTYREDYSNLKFIQTELTLKKITRDLYFYVNGGYGAIGSDTMRQSGFDLSFTTDPVSFQFNTDAEAFSGEGVLGYVAELTPDRYYEVNITPLFGFSIQYEKIKRKNPTPDPYVSSNISGADFFTVNSTLSEQDLKQKWYGIFIGFDFFANPRGVFNLGFGYRYHWLSLHQKFFSDLLIKTFDNDSSVLLNETITMNGKVQKNGNLGHSGYVTLGANPTRYILLSAIGKIHYFSSKVINANITQQTVEISPNYSIIDTKIDRKFKSRWLFFEVLLGLSFYL
ncbi:MAG: hypothetical protein COT84_08580 [Chlamydiae bacterium CG10_big_fil_rev_8_21_14_0_10_35_9]|nr:MAG: hypothetical protein COT84_08580 [Chlamydiae bacterium CG10_big_fil_rev_8_21_14_0_10_35_9]